MYTIDSIISSIHSTGKSRLAVDVRALAAFRIGIGATLLLDVILRSRYLAVFYTDAGVLPRTTLREFYPLISHLSIHTLSGSIVAQSVLFIITGVCSISVILGYRTRAAMMCSFFLIVSLHARNPIVLSAGDSLLRRLYFWGMFLPLGTVYSLDAHRDSTRHENTSTSGKPQQIFSVAGVGLLVQVLIVYLTNAGYKTLQGDWGMHNTLLYALHMDVFTTPIGALLQQHGDILAVLSIAWIGILYASVLLVFTTGKLRQYTVLLFMCSHLGMVFVLRIGIFPLVSIVALLPFLPTSTWDTVYEGIQNIARWLKIQYVIDSLHSITNQPLYVQSIRETTRNHNRSIRQRITRGISYSKTVTQILLVCLIGTLILWNSIAVGVINPGSIPESQFTPKENSWDMFTSPSGIDTFTYGKVTTTANTSVTNTAHADPDTNLPPDGAAWYRTNRWRKYMLSVTDTKTDELLTSTATGICNFIHRNQNVDTQTVTLRTIKQPPPMHTQTHTNKKVLTKTHC